MVSLEISIIIPTLNEEKTIRHTFESLQKQDFRHGFEVIIADGGSTDATLTIANDFNAIIVDANGQNIASSQNMGAALASAEILVFTQADTVFPTSWVRKIHAEFARDDDLIALTGPLHVTDDAPLWMKFEYETWNIFRWLNSLIPLPIGAFFSSGPNLAVRKWAFEKIGGYNTFLPMHEDGTLGKTLKKIGRVKFCGPRYLPIYVTVSPRRAKLGFRRMNRYYLYILSDVFPFNVLFPQWIWHTIRTRTWIDSLRSRKIAEAEIARRVTRLEQVVNA